MGMSASKHVELKYAPVVVVIATCGKDRVGFLRDRALSSVQKQIDEIDRIVVVSDNDKDDDVLSLDLIRSGFKGHDRDKVVLLHNSRTRHMSGTGAWNTGILEAFKVYGKDCWVAILDDDDEWTDKHVSVCLDASASSGADCKWVASGIIRKRSNGEDHKEPIPRTKPRAEDFFTTNPGFQGSNLFVKCGTLIEAGMFDENLPSTTDRDLCIRLSDLLQVDSEASFAFTGTYTVIHHAGTHHRVSTRGSPAKIDGLRIFYYKHAPRMNAAQRAAFKERAKDRFDCDEGEFLAQRSSQAEQTDASRETLHSWSGDELKLNRKTKALLPSLYNATEEAKEKKDGIFGIITGDLGRLEPLLKDLWCASESPHSDFRAFVVVFANNADPSFSGKVRNSLNRQKLRGHVIDGTNKVVQGILSQCQSYSSKEDVAIPLPICLSRTVLQVFIYYIAQKLEDVSAVVILDDDKRLPMGWSPFQAGDNQDVADVQIGRDLRTPPNPSLLSLRTNLLDVMYAFDLEYLKRDATCGEREGEVDKLVLFCQSIDILNDKFDWYYDKSSSRSNHLETPVISYGFDTGKEPPFAFRAFLRTLLSELLVGTPFSRDVIPPCESGPTLQRGGCLVVIKKDDSSFDVLAVEQDAPVITLAIDKSIHSRRSDSFWCKEIKNSKNKAIEVNPRLYVYHDNSLDRVPQPPVMRRTMVQEVLGGVLCRPVDNRRMFKDKAVLELKIWLSRVRGLLRTMRYRPYFTDEMDQELIRPLEAITDEVLWQQEVFEVVDREFEKLEAFEARPADFSAAPTEINTYEQLSEICFHWNFPRRIRDAADILKGRFGSAGDFVGLGHEGVVFQIEGFAYKVIDQVRRQDLCDAALLGKLGAAFVKGTPVPVIKSPFVHGGSLYRGGYGRAILQFLKRMKEMRLGCHNLTPDNLIIYGKGRGRTLKLVDLGRDLFMAPASLSLAGALRYEADFVDMCRRAFLCHRFGFYANNPDDLKVLKEWMRKSSRTNGSIPQLYGFDAFMSTLGSLQEGNPQHHRLFELLVEHDVTHPILISARSDRTGMADAIDGSQGDSVVLDSIAGAVKGFVQSRSEGRKVAVCIDDPLSHGGREHRPLWFYRRHLMRLGARFSFSMSEEDIQGVDQDCFERRIEYHVFFLSFDAQTSTVTGTVPESAGCHLMIKSCPMEHETILADVRRIVHTLERPSTFKCITLLVDWSISSGFLRQYTSCDKEDLNEYKLAIENIKEERLVDHIIEFGGKHGSKEYAVGVNRRWFGREDCSATHSVSRQQYGSTLFAFDQLQKLGCYTVEDIVLQCDADIMFHCDPSLDGVTECLSYFSRDARLLTFAFPILSKSTSTEKVYEKNGKPCRFETRCSFVHLERLFSMLPLKLSQAQRAVSDGFCIKQGWWRVLDDNIEDAGWRSCRGNIDGKNSWFFVHPQNYVKAEEGAHRMLAIADRLANALPIDGVASSCTTASKGPNLVWKEQQDCVDLTYSSEWLLERNEPYVVVAYGSDVSYGCALRFLDSLRRQIGEFKKENIGLILINDMSDVSHNQDTNKKIHEAARHAFGDAVSFLNIGKRLGAAAYVDHAVDSVCGNDASVITFARLEGCFLGNGSLRAIWKLLFPSTPDDPLRPYSNQILNAFWKIFATSNRQPPPCFAHGGVVSTREYSCSTSEPLFDGSGLAVFRKGIFRDIKDGSSVKGIESLDVARFVEGGVLFLIEDGRLEDLCNEETAECISKAFGICDECCALGWACTHAASINTLARCNQMLPTNTEVTSTRNHFPWKLASTELPCKELTVQLYVSEEIPEGDLRIQLVALVKGENISEAGMVRVRMHSECLTGDIFESQKCDCGEQKSRFIEIMKNSSHAVLLYIKGQEGRGAGLLNKIKAYYTLDRKNKGSITHIQALIQEGCEVDTRGYDAAVKFLRSHLKITFKSLVLHTNNPRKIAAVEEVYQDKGVKIVGMRTAPTTHNRQYLEEKEKLMGHNGLIDHGRAGQKET